MNNEMTKMMGEMADEYVFSTNGHKFSNNDNSAGDNFGSYVSGFTARDTLAEQEIAELKKQLADRAEKNQLAMNQGVIDSLEYLNSKLTASLKSAVDALNAYVGFTPNPYFPFSDECAVKAVEKIKSKHPDMFKGDL